MKTLLLLGAASVVAVAVACSSSSKDDAAPIATAKSSVTRDLAPALTAEEQTALANGQADFAVAFYKAVASATPNDSVIVSPHSASIALGMAYAGARGATATEMRAALHLALPDERVHTGFDYLDLELASRGQGATGQDGKPFRLTVANSMWGQRELVFETPFLDTLALDYGADMKLVDFAGNPDGSKNAINEWTEDNTGGRIKNIADGVVTERTRLALVNAVYFNAGWQTKFTKEATANRPFTKLDGSSVAVPTMNVTSSFAYVKGTGYEAIALPYEGGELSMVVIVPDAGTFSAFESGLTGRQVLAIESSLQPTDLWLSYPKHHVEATFDLEPALQALGMNAAFTAAADFSGISKTPLYIDKVRQKTFVDVDEVGTEAAAATIIAFADGGASLLPPTHLSVDRPFIEAIVDKKTKSLVFLGRVVEPKK